MESESDDSESNYESEEEIILPFVPMYPDLKTIEAYYNTIVDIYQKNIYPYQLKYNSFNFTVILTGEN